MKTIIKLVCLAILITGCAATPKEPFAEYYKSENPSQLGIVVNTFVVSDISGSDLGVNRKKNQEAMDIIAPAIQKHLQDRGYQSEIVYKNNGMLFDKQNGDKYFYSEDWKSTGEEYSGPQENIVGDPWLTEETRQFLIRLVDVAKVTGLPQSSRRKKSEPISADEVPEIIKQLPSDYFVFVNANCAEIGKGKSIGTGILTGVLSAALTGGMYVYSSTTVSGTY